MSRVTVHRDVLLWALERSRRPRPQLEKQFPTLEDWLAGERSPTLRQLDALARATSTPLGYFFLETPPAEPMPIPHFRTVHDELPRGPSPDLLDTIHMMQRRQAWMRDYLVEEGEDRLPFVRSAQLNEPVDRLALRIRAMLGLTTGWAAEYPTWTDALRALREAMEEAGIVVIVNGIVGNNTHRVLDPDEFRGFVLVDDYAPLVFVNGADGKAAQMFTLAHELAHVFLGSSAAFDLRQTLPAEDPVEQTCNRVAAEFLVPEVELRRAWRSFEGDADPLQSIARQFKVSEVVAARRALDLDLITKNAFFRFYNEYQAKERRSDTPMAGGNFYHNQNARVGRRFFTLVLQAVREGKLLYTDAYELTQLHGRAFERYAAALGLGSA